MYLNSNKKRIKRLYMFKKKRFVAELSILFIRNNEYKKNKARFNIANDSKFYSGKSRMIREYDSVNFRLGSDHCAIIFKKKNKFLSFFWTNLFTEEKRFLANKKICQFTDILQSIFSHFAVILTTSVGYLTLIPMFGIF
jgi:hypothetical protein